MRNKNKTEVVHDWKTSCNLGLKGRVYGERCDERVSVCLFRKQVLVSVFSKKMKRKSCGWNYCCFEREFV